MKRKLTITMNIETSDDGKQCSDECQFHHYEWNNSHLDAHCHLFGKISEVSEMPRHKRCIRNSKKR